MLIRSFLYISQGRLPFETESAGDDIEDELGTESALDEFTQDPSELLAGMGGVSTEDRHQDEFSEQVKKYAENKPKRNKRTTDRECQPPSNRSRQRVPKCRSVQEDDAGIQEAGRRTGQLLCPRAPEIYVHGTTVHGDDAAAWKEGAGQLPSPGPRPWGRV